MRVGRFCQEFLSELGAAVRREKQRLINLHRAENRFRSTEVIGPSPEDIARLIARLDDIAVRIVLLEQDAPLLRESESQLAASSHTDPASDGDESEVDPLLCACAQYELSAHRTLSFRDQPGGDA